MKIFLSHSGADTQDAEILRDHLLARFKDTDGFHVWLDKTDLRPGPDRWQEQIENAIETADAFLVIVGSSGAANWVEAEVRQGLSRAVKDRIPFIPILNGPNIESRILPPFARQYQVVRNPLADNRQFELLVSSLVETSPAQAHLVEEPFVGLRAMEEKDAHLFFGRDEEILELSNLLWNEKIVAIVADSGAGKSSLAKAGVVPAFRGGLRNAGMSTDSEGDHVRHVVTMQPGRHPLGGLKEGLNSAAINLGLDGETRAKLRNRVRYDDVAELVYALNCDLPYNNIETLLIVDQAEELVTQSGPEQRQLFLDLLLALIEPNIKGVRVLLTIRADYYNLFSLHEAFFERIARDPSRSQFRLKRLSEEAINDIIVKPLRLAGFADERDAEALAEAVRQDTFGRPGDTALVQFAIWSAWRNRTEQQSLTQAYAISGGLYGSLGKEAERVRVDLTPDQQNALMPLFARLVRPSGTGGATSRPADLSELDKPLLKLATHLSGEEGARLLQISDNQVQISHEALIRQWPWLQTSLESRTDHIRILRQITDASLAWAKDEKKPERLPLPSDLEKFDTFARPNRSWLSPVEAAFLDEATRRRDEALELDNRRERRAVATSYALQAAVVFLSGLVIYLSNVVLTERFLESTKNRVEIRQALFAGNIVSELSRNSIIPLLLSRDLALITALDTQDYTLTSQRVITFADETGASEIEVLDAGGRIIGASNRMRIGTRQITNPAFVQAARSSQTVFSVSETSEGNYRFTYSRRIDSGSEFVGVVVVAVDLAAAIRRFGSMNKEVLVLDSQGTVVLATDPRLVGLQENSEEYLSFNLASSGSEDVEGEILESASRIAFRGWQLKTFTEFSGVSERVNGILAIELMVSVLLFSSFGFVRRRLRKRQTASVATPRAPARSCRHAALPTPPWP